MQQKSSLIAKKWSKYGNALCQFQEKSKKSSILLHLFLKNVSRNYTNTMKLFWDIFDHFLRQLGEQQQKLDWP